MTRLLSVRVFWVQKTRNNNILHIIKTQLYMLQNIFTFYKPQIFTSSSSEGTRPAKL
jgi:hypothetical protein